MTDEDLLAQLDFEKQLAARLRAKNPSVMREGSTVYWLAEQVSLLRIEALNAFLGVGTPLPAGSLSTFIFQIGDSIGYGEKAGPWAAITHLGYEPKIISVNNANSIGGHTLAQVADELPEGIDSYYDPARRCIAVIQRGTNDIGNDKRSAADTYALLVPLVDLYKRQGFYVVVATLLPRNGSNYPFSAADQVQLTEYNRLVRANSAGADYIIDFKADPIIGADGAENGSLYEDGLHPGRTGQERLVIVYRNTLEPLFKLAPRISQTGIQLPYFRMVDLHQMVQIKNGPGFDYRATVAADFGHGVYCYSSANIPAGGNGYFQGTVASGQATTGSGVLFGLSTSVTPVSFYDGQIGLYTTTRRSNYSAFAANGAAEIDTGVPIDAGDILMMQRVGQTLNALVSKDGGSSWITAYTVGGITAPVRRADSVRHPFPADAGLIAPPSRRTRSHPPHRSIR